MAYTSQPLDRLRKTGSQYTLRPEATESPDVETTAQLSAIMRAGYGSLQNTSLIPREPCLPTGARSSEKSTLETTKSNLVGCRAPSQTRKPTLNPVLGPRSRSREASTWS